LVSRFRLESLREGLGLRLLTAQTIIKKHAGVAQKRPATFGQLQLLILYLDQTVIEQRRQELFCVACLIIAEGHFESRHELQNLFAKFAIFFGKQMATKRRNLSLQHTAFVNRKRFLVLMETGWRFRNCADAKT